jgi:uncharacterized surface protein with fasciclin (FAS1) repeats
VVATAAQSYHRLIYCHPPGWRYRIAQLVRRDAVLYFGITMKSCFRPRFTAVRWFVPVVLAVLMIVPALAKPPKTRDIADTLDANPILTKFAAMVRGADMGTFLSSRGPFTVFAPTDSAFARLTPGLLEVLLEPQNKERLQDIVLFHVINAKRLTALDLKALKTENSCQGSPLTFKVNHLGSQYVQKAKITHADIKTQNGIINEIDTLLMPPESALPPIAATPTAPPPAPPVTNAPPVETNTVPVIGDTNGVPVVPVAPVATPDATSH